MHPLEFSGKHNIPYLGLGALFSSDFMSDSLDVMTYGAQPIYRTPLLGGFIGSIRLVDLREAGNGQGFMVRTDWSAGAFSYSSYGVRISRAGRCESTHLGWSGHRV